MTCVDIHLHAYTITCVHSNKRKKKKKNAEKLSTNVVEDNALTAATQPLNPNELNRITLSANCNARTASIPTATTTTTREAATSKSKNCRGLIQKRAHTLDDFMEGKQILVHIVPFHQNASVVEKFTFYFSHIA